MELTKKENGRYLTDTHLDFLTSELFLSLRGGNANEENQYINTMQTCPICKTGLETLFLGFFEENGEKYERVLWRCPLQPAKKCYFPMNILPLDVFWIRRTMEQMQNGVKPLPNLHLLPKSQHHLYPKLFKPNSKGHLIDVENLVKLSSYLPARQRYSTKLVKQTMQHNVQKSRSDSDNSMVRMSSSSTVLTIVNLPIIQNHQSQIGMQSLIFATQNSANFSTSVRDFFKQKLRSGELKLETMVSQAKKDLRKQFDLCENTSAALKSHQLMLNGNASTSRDETQFLGNNLNSEVLCNELADPISHDQYMRIETKIRNAVMNAERSRNAQNQQEEQIGTNQEPVPLPNVRSRRRPSRYIPWTPSPVFRRNKNKDGEEGMKDGKKKSGSKKKQYQPKKIGTKSEALKQLELKREGKALTARFGVGNIPSNMATFESQPDGDLPHHYELIEGCLSTEEDYQSGEELIARLSQSRIEKEQRQCGSSNQTTLSSNSSWEGGSHKIIRHWQMDGKKGSRTGMDGASIGMDSNLEENIKFMQQRLVREAIMKRQNKHATTPSASNSTQSIGHQMPFVHQTDELSGIPHDFNQQHENAPLSSSQFGAINYEGGEQEAANKFANYDRFGKIMEVEEHGGGGMMEFDEYGGDFDFGFGLENEFQTNEDSGDGTFLRNLSSR